MLTKQQIEQLIEELKKEIGEPSSLEKIDVKREELALLLALQNYYNILY